MTWRIRGCACDWVLFVFLSLIGLLRYITSWWRKDIRMQSWVLQRKRDRRTELVFRENSEEEGGRKIIGCLEWIMIMLLRTATDLIRDDIRDDIRDEERDTTTRGGGARSREREDWKTVILKRFHTNRYSSHVRGGLYIQRFYTQT